MATLSAVSECSRLLLWGSLGAGRRSLGAFWGLKHSFCRNYLEWCEQPEEIRRITKAGKKRYDETEHGCGNIDPQT